MTRSLTIKVLIASSDQLVQRALTSCMAQADDIIVIGVVGDAAAVAEAEYRQTDVVLMEMEMFKMGGLEVVQSILTRNSRILIIASDGSNETILQALRARVHGFLLKTIMPESIVEAVRAINHGMTVFSADPIWRLGGKTADSEWVKPQLTDREEQVLILVSEGYSNAEISRNLYLSESRVKALVSSVMAKVGVDSRLKLAVRARDWY